VIGKMVAGKNGIDKMVDRQNGRQTKWYWTYGMDKVVRRPYWKVPF